MQCSRGRIAHFVLIGNEEAAVFFFILWFYIPQSTDVGNVVWSVGLRTAADPGYLFLRSLTGQCVLSSHFKNPPHVFTPSTMSDSKVCHTPPPFYSVHFLKIKD